MKRGYKILFSFFFLMMIGFMGACSSVGNKDELPDKETPIEEPNEETPVEVISVKFKDNEDTFEFDLNEYKLSDIKLVVSYSDETTSIVPVSLLMIHEEDINNLFKTGQFFMRITYLGYELEALFIVSSDKAQSNLADVVVYTVEETKEGLTTKSYYTTGLAGYLSYQLEFSFDQDKISNIQVKYNELLNGQFSSVVKENLIMLTYTQPTKVLGHTLLFEIIYQNSSDGTIDLNDSFDNAFYDFYEDVFKINDVAFYQR